MFDVSTLLLDWLCCDHAWSQNVVGWEQSFLSPSLFAFFVPGLCYLLSCPKGNINSLWQRGLKICRSKQAIAFSFYGWSSLCTPVLGVTTITKKALDIASAQFRAYITLGIRVVNLAESSLTWKQLANANNDKCIARCHQRRWAGTRNSLVPVLVQWAEQNGQPSWASRYCYWLSSKLGSSMQNC